MGMFGGFYKGDSKKKKKAQGAKTMTAAGPVFTPPTVMPKGKIKY